MNDDPAQLAAAINEHPDALHGDYTPAVHALIRLGVKALPAVLPLLDSDDRLTRLRAQRVLEGVTRAWVDSRHASQPHARGTNRLWQQLWHDNGNYDWQGDDAARARAVAQWRQWLDSLPA